MTPFDPPANHDSGHDSGPSPEDGAPTSPAQDQPAPLAGDPITYAATAQSPVYPQGSQSSLPSDLRVAWSWLHFVIFLFFTGASFILVQTALAIYYAPQQRLSKEQYEHYLLNKPEFLFGSNLIWYALIFLFLWVTLSVLRELPFWSTLGWRKLQPDNYGRKRSPVGYFLTGCFLAFLVAWASSHVHTNENMPIQELFKNRDTALLLMCMAVLVAPLVEETVFRGYLYPLFARSFGVAPGIVLTGVLFGLMHGSQLGWSWGIVVLLILVGVIFTFARAHTGTVLASFLLHLGYNSAIAVTSIIGTHGFTQMPPVH
jgi:membrane protease YdiL (CAAX protease family)